MNLEEVDDLHRLCNIIGQLKKQIIEELPHHGSEALFFHNDEITTGQLDNKIEIKIHLLANKLLYFNNEEGYSIDLNNAEVFDGLQKITDIYNLKLPNAKVGSVDPNQSLMFHNYATHAVKILELFRMTLEGKFTLVHLWPGHFDFSVEWFAQRKDEQIGIGISPGDKQHEESYLYINPWPFNKKITKENLPIGKWHTSDWNGIKVEWNELLNLPPKIAVDKINELYSISKKSFVA